MKNFLGSSFALLLALSPNLQAQTLNWGSLTDSDFADSNGVTLDNTYVFELGAFSSGFMPDEENLTSWRDNWNVFDRAAYSQENGVFASSVEDGLQMTDDGLSNSSYLNHPIVSSFEGLSAYLWVRKGDQPVEGSEWLLVRSDSWIFPNAVPGCCDNQGVVNWSVSDLGSSVPKWGNQDGVQGPGVFTDPGTHDLQTYTFVPEPASAVFISMAGLAAILRRRRVEYF